MSQGIVYALYCKESERYYVGQTTKPINKRWQEHIYEANRMSDKPLYRAIRKHGAGSFKVRVIEECDLTLLDERETYWIKHYNSFSEGYNQTDGSGGHYRISDEVKQKISDSMIGKEKSLEHASKISESLKRINHTFKIRGDGKHSRRKIKTINVDTLEETIYESGVECAKALGIEPANLSRSIANGWKVKGHRVIRIDERPLSHAIYGIDKKTNKIKYAFPSVRAAGRELGTGGDSGCTKSLKHPHKYTWKGCYWFYQQ